MGTEYTANRVANVSQITKALRNTIVADTAISGVSSIDVVTTTEAYTASGMLLLDTIVETSTYVTLTPTTSAFTTTTTTASATLGDIA